VWKSARSWKLRFVNSTKRETMALFVEILFLRGDRKCNRILNDFRNLGRDFHLAVLSLH